MRTIKIYCKECGSELTNELTEFPVENLRWQDEDIIPKNSFSIVDNKQLIILAISEYNLMNHANIDRFNGYSGSDGTNGLNKLCLKGHEVATECSDYWTGNYIGFAVDKLIIKEKTDEYTFKRLRL
jgi:hypothetical protein